MSSIYPSSTCVLSYLFSTLQVKSEISSKRDMKFVVEHPVFNSCRKSPEKMRETEGKSQENLQNLTTSPRAFSATFHL